VAAGTLSTESKSTKQATVQGASNRALACAVLYGTERRIEVSGYKKGRDRVIGVAGSPLELNIDGSGQRLTVSVFQYADNPAKIGIQRFILNSDEPRAVKLGRLTAEEAEYIAARLPEAVKILRAHTGK